MRKGPYDEYKSDPLWKTVGTAISLKWYGYLQRYFSKPIFRNHFTIRCENDDLNFCRF